MKVGAIVQARMSSTRLPGKVLRPILGKPMLQYLLESLATSRKLDAVVLATSSDESDDPLVLFCKRAGISCHRGSLDNVASRFNNVLKQFEWDAFVRLSGDSPLLDRRLVDRAIELAKEGEADLVVNIFPRTFPRGQSVEFVRRDAFARGFEKMDNPFDVEHVTPYFYRNSQLFKIDNFQASADYSQIHLAVDTPANFTLVESILRSITRPHTDYSVDKWIDFYYQRPADKA